MQVMPSRTSEQVDKTNITRNTCVGIRLTKTAVASERYINGDGGECGGGVSVGDTQ